jgi:hypothetical protein
LGKLAETKKKSEITGKLASSHYSRVEGTTSSLSEKADKVFAADIFMGWCKAGGIGAPFCPHESLGQDVEASVRGESSPL